MTKTASVLCRGLRSYTVLEGNIYREIKLSIEKLESTFALLAKVGTVFKTELSHASLML